MISSLLRRPIIDIINKRSFTTTNNILNIYDMDNIEANRKGINTEDPDIYEKYEVLKAVKTKESLKKSLKKFREIVKRETSKKGYNSYYGWPPRNRIKVVDDEKLGAYGRTLFVFNRSKGINEKEPNLCICCKNKGILLFNKPEFESLLKNMNTIKHQLEEFAKKI
ncbi:conserved Plasmodium protein, unknown function [Plasmodium berghei]|uniref:Uncharacterized protein n=2 Tax=Plasmodium berghei TaxID=5821 RepID=A0A509AXX9_PLABA|nr:conserved protein, unknown function [Plasmodium berghei ANKA]CXJ01519.1 conserved Plasmodium protein, unknown function [Plasmodium berghei]SCL98195.1 conserved Plasmodium protein, unknown function [Plasmodium berghei]SCM16773.1 conserved Plasmodium protein, unknown function [Plasmodium berghei]SCM18571.1 conserved Plasmodium protein, unknown function [Plasmodium berghei]SCN28004.1 conserved Plasmodium protein, unknown function [Plasmodium berghei]|eukprot:XP_034423657.1 conserved protein, unknown function [Plasmodium berghei ANKA]